ncbi:MAG: hypothetical protein RKP46_10575 [Candidatus Accumulibacter sp.]|uniref:hypothetical protein n=1 Tax=Accumulibacter sp. TaxID=2053492 RepID=UPI002878608A|nr:hypothetical protein [Accumulibacter sp.]MDS4014785.1 hypothetical protein [Accumulibacter sp.]
MQVTFACWPSRRHYVVLSALLWRGPPHHLLAAISQRSSIQLYISMALLEELADVLTWPSENDLLQQGKILQGSVLT